MQEIPHYVDSNLTKENARIGLKKEKITIAIYKNEKNKNSVVHSHPYHELILPIAGSDVIYSIAGGLHRVHVGELIYLPSEVYHSGRFIVTSNSSERMVVQIDDQIWQKAQSELSEISRGLRKDFAILDRDSVIDWKLKGLFERMAQSVSLDLCYHDKVFMAQTMELQALIAQITRCSRPAEAGNTSELANRAVSYLQNHYKEQDLTVTKLAQEIYTSREHLSRVFKQYTMESVHSYLTNLRMQNCRRLLAMGKTVLDACNDSGFSNYTSFLKAFHHLYGMSPSTYRGNVNREIRKNV